MRPGFGGHDREQPSQEFVRADSTPVLVELANDRQRREGQEANDAELQFGGQEAQEVLPHQALGLTHCVRGRTRWVAGSLEAALGLTHFLSRVRPKGFVVVFREH